MRFTISLWLLLSTTSAMAQLPNGSVAPDFTATDIDGVEWNLYELLDAGTTVIIDFYATWCGPCWSYRATGALDDVWEQLGPDGTGEVMIFSMESDDTTTADDLAGTGSNSWGDWITGTPFPMFDNCGDIFSLYGNAYFPTIYTICPSHILTESGQQNAAGHIAVATAADCAAAIDPTDVSMLSYTGETVACAGSPTAISVELMNMGTEPLTACTIELVYNGAIQLSYNWTGNLDTYGVTDVQVGSHEFSSTTSFGVRVVAGGDANVSNNAVISTVELATPSTSFIYVHILTDGWGGETSWELVNGNGDVVQSVGGGTLGNTTEYTWEVEVDLEVCHTFTISDSYGDGIDGYCRVTSLQEFPSVDFGADPVSTILDYDGTTNFNVLSAGFTTSLSNIAGCTYVVASNFNPTANFDDGSCEFSGCTDPLGVNYYALFNLDDGSCVYEPEDPCLGDLNGDELVGISDLLMMLGEFGGVCP
jgi:hypothetical protein